jgi:hypothetical protein
MLLTRWIDKLLDEKGALKMERSFTWKFLRGLKNSLPCMVLFLLKNIYGLKQTVIAFWRELLKVFRSIGFDRSNVEPCLYLNRTHHVVWVSWIDDCLLIGNP